MVQAIATQEAAFELKWISMPIEPKSIPVKTLKPRASSGVKMSKFPKDRRHRCIVQILHSALTAC